MRLDEDVVIAPACVGQSRLHEQDTVGKEFYESADKTITVYRQETLEEAAERILLGEDLDLSDYDKRHILKAMLSIAKWQQEQDKNKYSEEDMLNFSWFLIENIGQFSCDRTAHFEGKYLEQFKNK